MSTTKTCETCGGPARLGTDVPPMERGGTVIKFAGKLADPNAKAGPGRITCGPCMNAARVPVDGRGL